MLVVLYGLSVMVFGCILVGKAQIIAIITGSLAILYFFIPFRWIIREILQDPFMKNQVMKQNQENIKKYSDLKFYFVTDFDRENPYTSQDAWEAFFEKKRENLHTLKQKKKDDEQFINRIKRSETFLAQQQVIIDSFQRQTTFKRQDTYLPDLMLQELDLADVYEGLQMGNILENQDKPDDFHPQRDYADQYPDYEIPPELVEYHDQDYIPSHALYLPHK